MPAAGRDCYYIPSRPVKAEEQISKGRSLAAGQKIKWNKGVIEHEGKVIKRILLLLLF